MLAPLLVLAIVASVGTGAALGLRWSLLKANPFFTLRKIDVRTDGEGLSEETVIAILDEMGFREGETNMFDIDVRAIRERLEKAAIVESARVYRVLPDLLVVNFSQRRPVARLRARIPRFVDGQGHVLLPWEADGFSLLPDIVGTRDVDTFRPGQKVDDEVLLGALHFLRLNEDYAERLNCDVHMIQLDYHPPEKLKLYVHRAGTFREQAQVLVPVQRMEEALNRLAVIVRDRTEMGLPTSFADVTYEENVPVRE
jgi:cell division septal protein FtsQ